jgi:hypothetical protein
MPARKGERPGRVGPSRTAAERIRASSPGPEGNDEPCERSPRSRKFCAGRRSSGERPRQRCLTLADDPVARDRFCFMSDVRISGTHPQTVAETWVFKRGERTGQRWTPNSPEPVLPFFQSFGGATDRRLGAWEALRINARREGGRAGTRLEVECDPPLTPPPRAEAHIQERPEPSNRRPIATCVAGGPRPAERATQPDANGGRSPRMREAAMPTLDGPPRGRSGMTPVPGSTSPRADAPSDRDEDGST